MNSESWKELGSTLIKALLNAVLTWFVSRQANIQTLLGGNEKKD